MDILGIRLSKLRAHPLLLLAELDPEHEEEEDENDEPAQRAIATPRNPARMPV